MNMVDTELEIMNSNSEYNLIAFDKASLEEDDIVKEHKEAEELNVERYLVKNGKEYIGVLDYGMSSPRQQKPWLSLLVIHKKYQGFGYAKKLYMAYENLMIDKQVNTIQIAVHSTNEKALKFWMSLGFMKRSERIYDGKLLVSLEKKVN